MASMQNTGWETSVNVRVINSANFKWDIGLNIGNYKNKVPLSNQAAALLQSMPGATILTKNGSDANLFYGYKSMGVFQQLC
jgi:hypothetical protein